MNAEMITEMLKNYNPPVLRKATVCDFLLDESNCVGYTDRRSDDRILDNRLQREYGERKRIKP